MRVLPDGAMDLMWSEDRFLFAGADTTVMISSSESGGVTWGGPRDGQATGQGASSGSSGRKRPMWRTVRI
ncbi:hypothetical protein [Streptomyces sp. NPDC048385]|uniref:hypothetical protein n=1 Tax=Streptomyces sp. NPDC048385 TaxID=3155145 RepID=UPI0034318083